MIYNPHQYMCMRCTKLRENCDHLKFEKMKVVGEYIGVSKLVKCTEYVKRELTSAQNMIICTQNEETERPG